MRQPGWNVSAGPELCSGNIQRGYPAHDIVPRVPFYVTAGAVYRCVHCTEAPRDEQAEWAIAHAEQELARVERRAREAAARTAGEAPPPGVVVDVHQLIADVNALIGTEAAHHRPAERIRPPRRPIPFDQLEPLPFDPKAAAIGDD
jgi:hypothetical protein